MRSRCPPGVRIAPHNFQRVSPSLIPQRHHRGHDAGRCADQIGILHSDKPLSNASHAVCADAGMTSPLPFRSRRLVALVGLGLPVRAVVRRFVGLSLAFARRHVRLWLRCGNWSAYGLFQVFSQIGSRSAACAINDLKPAGNAIVWLAVLAGGPHWLGTECEQVPVNLLNVVWRDIEQGMGVRASVLVGLPTLSFRAAAP